MVNLVVAPTARRGDDDQKAGLILDENIENKNKRQ